jgi:colanic acid/amylovoran biosynthesis glycosyltransferase
LAEGSAMIETEKDLRLAVVVEDFLPISQVWIWRQIKLQGLAPKVILTYQKSNSEVFDFPDIVVASVENRWIKKIRKKLWFVFKYVEPRISRKRSIVFKSALKNYKINLVHAHFGTVGTEIADICKELNIPLVITFHGFDATSVPDRWPGYKKKLRSTFDACSVVISISKYLSQKIAELGCAPEKIKVNYLGVPIGQFTFTDRVARQGRIKFIHIGRIVEKKGVPDLVRAFVAAFPEETAVELMIIGTGEETVFVESLIKELSPSNPIVCKDFVTPDQVRNELDAADVFVLNSRVDSKGTTEGLPIGMLEAMATGMPVITTNHAGIPEVISNGFNGFLIEEKNITALSDTMKKCCDRKQNDQLGRNAYETVRQRFSTEENGKELRKIYHTILK